MGLKPRRLQKVITAIFAMSIPLLSWADIIRDGSITPLQPTNGLYDILENSGDKYGSNLLHNFNKFEILSGESVHFRSNDSAINNIIARVTGADKSLLDGLLKSDKNFYLINPNGIIFGPDGSLDITGSFNISTSDSLLFDNGAILRIGQLIDTTLLSTASPTAFGFLNDTSGDIVFNLNSNELFTRSDLSLHANNIHFNDGSKLSSNNGSDITLFAANDIRLNSDLSNVRKSSIVTRSNSNETGGAISVTANNLYVEGGSSIRTISNEKNGGDITLAINNELVLSNQNTAAKNPSIHSNTQGNGDGGNILINAAAVTLQDGARIKMQTSSVDIGATSDTGKLGDLTINADTITLNDGSRIESVMRNAGDNGSITLNATESISLSGSNNEGEKAAIHSRTESNQDGHSININSQHLELKNGSWIESQTSGFERVESNNTGNSGEISINSQEIELNNRAYILTFSNSHGDAGNISINADSSLVLSGVDNNGNASSIRSLTKSNGHAGDISIAAAVTDIDNAFIANRTEGLGDAGDITMTGDTITLSNGSFIVNKSENGGSNGHVVITATDTIELNGYNQESLNNKNQIRPSAIFSINAGDNNGGDVNLNADNIKLIDGGSITMTAVGNGDGGRISLDASNEILLSGFNNDDIYNASQPELRRLGIGSYSGRANYNQAEVVLIDDRVRLQYPDQANNDTNTGNAGAVTLRAKNVMIDDGGFVEVSTNSQGQGNDIDIEASEKLTIQGTDVNGASSLISTVTQSNKNAGDIHITGNEIAAREGAVILTQNLDSSQGNTGSITLAATDNITISGYNPDKPDQRTTVQTVSSNQGDSGNINIASDTIMLSNGALVNSENKGTGQGGDINLNAADRLITLDSAITSSASGVGNGGNINITSNHGFFIDSNIRANGANGGNIKVVIPEGQGFKTKKTIFNAESTRLGDEQGVDGILDIPDLTNVEDIIDSKQLETEFINISSLLRQRCSAYEPSSQFTIFNQSGVAASPEGLLPSIDPISKQTALTESNAGLLAQNQGAITFRSGKLDQAKTHWTDAVDYYAQTGNEAAQANALRGTAQVQQAQGEYNASVATLAQAVDIARRRGDQNQLAESLGSLGNALIATGNPQSAQEMLEKAVQIADDTHDRSLSARLRNNLGNYYSVNNRVNEALENYLKSIDASIETDQYAEATKAYANIARLKINDLEAAGALGSLKQAEALMKAIEPSIEKANLHIHLAKSYRLLADSHASFDISLKSAYDHLQDAKTISQEKKDDRLLSYTLGNLGSLYHVESRYQEALVLTHQALSLAEKANAPASQYRWHWQEGQLLREQGKTQAAVDAYKRAITIIEDTRQTTLARYESADVYFKQQVQPIYRELADILIQSSVRSDSELQAQQLLRDTRDIIEQLKTAELENYFHDDCIANFEAKRKNLDDVSPKTAIVYPIVLKDRTELLVSLPDLANPYQRQLIRRAVPVAADTLDQSVNDFRDHIEAFTYRSELQNKSQPLYNWLVKPYADDLKKHNVDTIVFVPDGTLRTLPMSALHDGQQYLIEDYALAITSSLTLSDPRPLSSTNNHVLLAGVSEAINNFPALDAVPGELAAVQKLYGGDVLLDNEFTADAFTNKVKNNNYSIIHIASHAQFTGDDRNSFLQAHDQPLFMDGLKSALSTTKYRDEPLEMLVLSACQTASGDERAALGLAGVGIKAGARSAMGSLWNIGDDSASELIEYFYTELQHHNASKAEALRQAQLSLLNTDQYSHPAHWAAFMLIDNWL